jgi:hypothetical protein
LSEAFLSLNVPFRALVVLFIFAFLVYLGAWYAFRADGVIDAAVIDGALVERVAGGALDDELVALVGNGDDENERPNALSILCRFRYALCIVGGSALGVMLDQLDGWTWCVLFLTLIVAITYLELQNVDEENERHVIPPHRPKSVTISPIKHVRIIANDQATKAARTYDYMRLVDTNNFEQDFEDSHFGGTAAELSDYYFDPAERRLVHPVYASVDDDGPYLDRNPDPEVFELMRDENGVETWTRDETGRLEVTPESKITYRYPLYPAGMPGPDDDGDVLDEPVAAAIDEPAVPAPAPHRQAPVRPVRRRPCNHNRPAPRRSPRIAAQEAKVALVTAFDEAAVPAPAPRQHPPVRSARRPATRHSRRIAAQERRNGRPNYKD